MFKKEFSLILLILLIGFISCACNSTQININTASIEELDKITEIGPSRAQQIISLRPFNSVDDLVRVSGIAELTLNKIKNQSLACVENEEDEETEIVEEKLESEEEINETPIIKEENKEEIIEIQVKETPITQKSLKTINLTPINLNSKNIKTEESKEILKKKLSFYGIITFGVIFGVWFLSTRKKNKNEFR